MGVRSVAGEIEELRRQIEHHNRKYYFEDAPEISDLEFDRLMRRLIELEAAEKEHAHAERVQSALYRIAELASAAQDMQEFYRAVHEVVGELMDATLGVVQRFIPEARDGWELALEEIALALDIPLGTVKSRIHNAIAARKSSAAEKRASGTSAGSAGKVLGRFTRAA